MAEFEFDIRDIFRIAHRRRWVIILAPLVVGTLTYLTSEVPPPVYQAESVVKISRVAASMQTLLVEALSWYEGDNIATQSQIIQSRKIGARVVLRLAEKYPEFQEVRAILGDGEEEDYDVLEERVRSSPRLVELVDYVGVVAERIENSDTVGITAQASSEQLAIDIANYTAQEFVNYNIAERNSQIRQAVLFIRGRIRETDAELGEAEKRLEEFKRDYGAILGLNGSDGGNILDQMESLGRTITSLEVGIERLGSMSDVAQYLSFAPALNEVSDPLISQLEQQLLQLIIQINDLKAERHQLLSYWTEQSREFQQNLLRTEEREESGREIILNLIQRYRVIHHDLGEKRRSLTKLHNEMEGIPEAARQLGSLERQVVLQTESLNLFQRRLQDAEIQQASEIREITIVEQASTAEEVPQTSMLFRTSLALVIGLMLGGIFAVILESLDTSIGTIEDVERYVQLPVLGVIPHLDVEMVRARVLVDELAATVTPAEMDRITTLCTHFAPKESISEAFRSMRAQLEVRLRNNGWKTLMITSSVLQEGKTSIACNLAVVFGQAGQRTLLIDADLRRPTVNKVFGVSQGPGLSEVLLGTTDWQSATKSMDDLILGQMGLKNSHMTPGLEYLFLLTSGRRVDSPAELLSLERITGILSEMRDSYDIIIVDVAPVLPVAEASQMAPGIDATLIAYQIGRIGRDVVTRTKTRLETVGAEVIGLVMNDIEAEIYYSRDYEYYGYKYKYEEAVPTQTSSGPLGRLKQRLSNFVGRAEGREASQIFQKPSQKPQKPQGGRSRPSLGSAAADHELEDIMQLTDEE